MSATNGETSQTLDRGLAVLWLLAAHSDGLTAGELAERLSTARAVVYRLLRTLESHRLIGRAGTRYVLGFGIAELASHLRPRLQATVLPILRQLSEQTNSTALLSVADGDQALVLLTEEPPQSTFHLALRQGARHPLDVGADGLAILAGRPAADADPQDVKAARRAGYALSVGALQTGAIGVAAPIAASDWATASIGVVQLGVALADPAVPELVMAAAAEAARRLSGEHSTESAVQA
ncbi:MAG TPA: helix-turn-helix domain-containing protein [Actinocrinis sp.]|uniref:IclR family transcriptional regulator n=1 Tax=Actinocrinis sp. TaxID=1920516 RepID=UPI002D2A025F|nr:helix-turn-helix domain-containing protein [Actinocrinis sp.]HZU57158.1 helix-turn-helix domain-containing protein [Actinocrinis sp.]